MIAANSSRNNLFKEVGAVECTYHEGYHYAAKAATDDESGWKEFWACCKCHHQYIGSAPAGNWVDQSEDNMDGVVDKNHIAFIPSLTSGEGGDYHKDDPFNN